MKERHFRSMTPRGRPQFLVFGIELAITKQTSSDDL